MVSEKAYLNGAICSNLGVKVSFEDIYILANSMETLEFVIYPDGRVQEKVTGILGASCTEVTAALEAELGHVVSHEQTSEFFDIALQQSNVATTQTAFSEW